MVVQSMSQVDSSTRRLQLGADDTPVSSGTKWWKERPVGDIAPLPSLQLPSVPLPKLPSMLPAAGRQ